jgi:hypothetical protein
MTVVATFNAPPGWPPAPPGWRPPVGWQPDASWPPAPPGWYFWPDDATEPPARARAQAGQPGVSQVAWGTPAPVVRRRRTAAFWAVGGGVAVMLGPAFPFVSQRELDLVRAVTVNPGALVMSGLFGAALTGLALAMLSRAKGVAIVELVLSAVGFLGYLSFAVVGAVGVPTETGFGFSVTTKWDPGFGLLLSMLGCLVVVVASVLGLRSAWAPTGG